MEFNEPVLKGTMLRLVCSTTYFGVEIVKDFSWPVDKIVNKANRSLGFLNVISKLITYALSHLVPGFNPPLLQSFLLVLGPYLNTEMEAGNGRKEGSSCSLSIFKRIT